jgi:Phage capsid family
MALDDFITRAGAAAELPVQLVSELVTSVSEASIALTMAHQASTTVQDSRIPVLSELPDAAWITGDVGLKGVTTAAWENKTLLAEELATIAVIPQNVVDDSQFDVWAAVRPLLAAAIARKFDDAVLFGTGAPTSFPPGLVQQATTAGNVVSADVMADDADNPAYVLRAAQIVAENGYNANAFAVARGWEQRAAVVRTNALVWNPIGAGSPFAAQLAGMGMRTRPLRWRPDLADAIVADWSLVIVGLRKDITIEPFNSGVISDATGKVVQNLLQEDKVAVRVTFRAGYLLARPPTDAEVVNPCPVAIVKNVPAARSGAQASSRSTASGKA